MTSPPAAGRDALRAAAEALLDGPGHPILSAYSVEDLAERYPAVLMEAITASASSRARLLASPTFAALTEADDAWRRLLGSDEPARRQAAADLLASGEPGHPPDGENARLRAQVAALRRRVDDLGRAGRREVAALAAAEVRRLRGRLERADAEAVRLRAENLALASEREEAAAELRSMRRSMDELGSLPGGTRHVLEAVERGLASTGPPSPAAAAEDHERHEARRRALDAAGAALRALLESWASPQLSARPAVAGLRPLEVCVTPLGGGREIGASCLLVEIAGRRILIDCGIHPGAARIDELGPPGLADALSGPIDAVFLTHAHNDHVGYVPALVRARHPALPIFATPQTAALLPPVWTDAVRLWTDRQRLAARFSGEDDEPPEAPFGPADVDAALAALRTVPFDSAGVLGDLEYRMFPAGHVLGAAGVVLRAGERIVVISGDICDRAQASVGAADLDPVPTGPDLLVLESTYCRDEHPGRGQEVARFVQDVEDVVRSGGRVLVPVFGLGRAQEVAMILRDRLPHVPVRIDGMARAISRIYEDQWRLGGRPQRILSGNIREVSGDRRLEAATFRRGVVVTTSGMLTGGPAVQWARAVLPDPRSALFLCGYQDEDSPGRRLLALADEPHGRRQPLELADGGRVVRVPVQARVARYQLSAHADRPGLVSVIDRVRPAATMLVHGNRRDQAAFRSSLNAAGRRAVETGRWTAGARR